MGADHLTSHHKASSRRILPLRAMNITHSCVNVRRTARSLLQAMEAWEICIFHFFEFANSPTGTSNTSVNSAACALMWASELDYTSPPNGRNNLCHRCFSPQSSWSDYGWSWATSPPLGGDLHQFTLLWLSLDGNIGASQQGSSHSEVAAVMDEWSRCSNNAELWCARFLLVANTNHKSTQCFHVRNV